MVLADERRVQSERVRWQAAVTTAGGTRSSATAEVPRDAPCHSKPCQLLHGCGTSRTTDRRNAVRARGTADRRLIDSHVDRRMFCQQEGLSTSFVDNTIDSLWRNYKSRIWVKVPDGSDFPSSS